MSILDTIAQAIFEQKPELFVEIKQKLCKHPPEDVGLKWGEQDVPLHCYACGKDLDTE